METTKVNGSSPSQAPIEESDKRPLLCGFVFGMDSIATGCDTPIVAEQRNR
jgi:hypothetical protein